MFTVQAWTDFDGQCFAAEGVDRGQSAKAGAVNKLIGYEVQTLDFIRARGRMRCRRTITIRRRFGSSSEADAVLLGNYGTPGSCRGSSPDARARRGYAEVEVVEVG
jgi:hypothetical protein